MGSYLLQEALRSYPIHPAARARVEQAAYRKLMDDPELAPTAAVEFVLPELTDQCHGCGLLVLKRTACACDLCGHPVCPSCLTVRWGLTIVAICPRCVRYLPRDQDLIQKLRAWVVRDMGGDPL